MITEEQARTKWCPFARSLVFAVNAVGHQSDAASYNRNVDGQPSTPCVASKCMAWRDAGEHPEGRSKAETEFRRTGRRLDTRRLGYCGLAGSPRP